MRILQMVDVPWDSGLAHYSIVLSLGLQGAGHRVYFSALPGEKPWLKAQRLGLETVPFSTFNGLRPLRRFLQDQRIELVNAHTGATHSLAVAAAWGQPVAVIRTRSDARRVRRTLGSSVLFKKTNGIIAAADYIREDYLRVLKIPKHRVTTVYQGLDISDYLPNPVADGKSLGIIARLDPVKGHRFLIEALSLLTPAYPDLRLKIVGQEENVKTRDLKNIAERLRLDNRVDFLGFQSDIPKATAGCAIGIIASTGSEAVSRVALEWMAAGRPVIATRVGCLPEIVQDGVTGVLVEPRNAPALAQAIGDLLNHPQKALAMGRAGRARVQKEFSIRCFVESTESAYARALKEARDD